MRRQLSSIKDRLRPEQQHSYAMIEIISGSRPEHSNQTQPPQRIHDPSRISQEPYRSPVFFHTRSPDPQYSRYESSTDISSLPVLSQPSDTRSPIFEEYTFTTKATTSPPTPHYTEVYSPDPEVVSYNGTEDKEAYDYLDKHLSQSSYPESVQTYKRTSSIDHPQVYTSNRNRADRRWSRPWYTRWPCILLLVVVAVIIAVGIALGVVFALGHKGSANTHTGDPDLSIGGNLDPKYYSKSGAFNGSGIALAAAKPGVDTSLYAFYQDYTGHLSYSLMDPTLAWNVIGPVNSGSHKALNGTPLSTVQHQVGNLSYWHLFYIDEDYYVRERIFTNDTSNGPTPIWTDGPLNTLNLRAFQANSIGMQGCYWGDFYGRYSVGGQARTTGIHLWYADSATTFQQYDWVNGTNTWTANEQWTGLDGHAGVACQTWDSGTTEYVWFVDTSYNIAMYWKDSNQTGEGTTTHPLRQWTPVNISISDVHKASSMGFTNYAMYQAADRTLRGANIYFAAENTTIANTTTGTPDTFVVQQDSENIEAIRGTHLSITAPRTPSKGALLLIVFQQLGNDMQMYTRDAFSPGGVWQSAGQDPVTPGSDNG